MYSLTCWWMFTHFSPTPDLVWVGGYKNKFWQTQQQDLKYMIWKIRHFFTSFIGMNLFDKLIKTFVSTHYLISGKQPCIDKKHTDSTWKPQNVCTAWYPLEIYSMRKCYHDNYINESHTLKENILYMETAACILTDVQLGSVDRDEGV